ncbi:hypothetical protein EK21DRAFT_86473 [Setomelanomma holmii]|uniref:Uncharacterized protein n=1 Tax=Setomelanomma holmii TaxID=210430 RepID=A0A9P4HE14_9PLEO|nr:hypothetical protein EK21DRAFT_86473 [Setomelanomma holmii]
MYEHTIPLFMGVTPEEIEMLPPPRCVLDITATMTAGLQHVMPGVPAQLDAHGAPQHDSYEDGEYMMCVLDVWTTWKYAKSRRASFDPSLRKILQRARLHSVKGDEALLQLVKICGTRDPNVRDPILLLPKHFAGIGVGTYHNPRNQVVAERVFRQESGLAIPVKFHWSHQIPSQRKIACRD